MRSDREPGFPKGRTAFLVIHGIGEQNPYETLDGFGRGMYAILKGRDGSVQAEHRMAVREDPDGLPWTEHYVRLKPKDGGDYIDIHEYYWAYLTEKRISVAEIWEWAAKTLEATERFYRDNKDLAEKYEGKYRFRRVARLLCVMRLVYPLVSLIPAVFSVVPIMRFRWFEALANWAKKKATYILIGYIGDIAIYTSVDEKSQFFPVRRNILNKCLSLLEELLQSDYDRVIVAGHSLGSVIGYDTLNRLNIKANAAGGEKLNLHKLRGLVTFGSPLDKIAFFFREHARKQQEFRRQIVEHLHSFRAKPLDIANYTILVNNPIRSHLAHVCWVNYFNTLDPVSGQLDYYHVDENREVTLPGPWGVAHVQYWDDRASFYQHIADRFLS